MQPDSSNARQLLENEFDLPKQPNLVEKSTVMKPCL